MLLQLVAIAQAEQVDAVIIAGDIYDRSVPPASAVALLDEVLDQLVRQLAIPVIMIAGNHDSHERLGFASSHMAESGLHIIGPLHAQLRPITLIGKQGSAVFYGLPYADPASVREVFESDCQSHEEAMAVLLAQVHQHDSVGLPKVVVSHCFLDGGDESDSERPLSIGGADKVSPSLFRDFNYVALGHLHGPQYKGAEHVRYSGSILKYSFSEQRQKKSVTVVTLNDQGQASVEQVALKPQRDVRIIEGYLAELVASGEQDPHREDYVMIRLLDTHAILDAIGKLRTVFPNVLHLERTGLMADNSRLANSRDHAKKGELTMFSDFFEQVFGGPLTEQQQEHMQQTIEAIHKAEQQQ